MKGRSVCICMIVHYREVKKSRKNPAVIVCMRLRYLWYNLLL